MWTFLECISSAVYKIDRIDACIIAGAIFGFFIQLVIIALWEASSNRSKRE